jgi:hypothetical protein
MKFIKSFLFTGMLALIISSTALAQQAGSLSGQVVDANGAVIVGATVTAISADGKEKTATSNQRGEFTIPGLAAGKYTVKAIAPKFALYENTEVAITGGQKEDLSVTLTVEGVQEQVEVSNQGVSTDSDNNAGATVLKDKDLEALPDDPDELEAALQALAGPSAGPNGGQIYIDGFTGGQLPPKDSIREIRINQNPFSAEYERLGFGRIEIFTKPGSDKWRGQAFFNFNDESLNSRNPFALNRAPSQTRFFGGSVSGPIQKGKSSFFLDINNRDVDNNTIINALVLDPALNVVPFQQDVRIPTRRLSFSPRFDYQLNDSNTLVARYNFGRSSTENQGIGDTSLPSRAYATTSTEHEFQMTETMIINPKTINETRFRYSFNKREQEGDNSIPTVSVPSAFVGGGAQIGLSFNRANTWELQNYTTTSMGKASAHSVKFGVRLRGVNISDRSENNFGGTFTFPGIGEVRSPSGCDLSQPPCTIVTPAVSPIEQYRQKLLGNPDPRFNPSQFRISAGDPLAGVNQVDMGLFVSDDWRVNPGLTLSFGLRYENQTNIGDSFNFAPRFAIAWSPGAGGARPPKTVFRGGFGIFYDRFNESYTLQTERFNGIDQLDFTVNITDPDLARRAAAITLLTQPNFTLTGVTNVPTIAQIQSILPSSSTIRVTDPTLNVPRTYQWAVGMERQLPAKTTLAMFYIGSKVTNMLRSRNINAPICATPLNCVGALRPDPLAGNIYEYEANGRMTQNQFIMNFRTILNAGITLFGNYRLGFANGDTDGAGTFPAYTYDLSDEYSRSSFDIRHNFVIGGNINMPHGISLSPFVIASSGRPFNITRGFDPNGDFQLTERPTFGELGSRCAALGLQTTYCDVAGQDPNAIIPRNYGQGPGYFSVNLRVAKNFGFGGPSSKALAAGAAQTGGGGQPAGGGGGARGGGGGNRGGGGGNRGGGGGGAARGAAPGGGGFFGGGNEVRKPYNLNLGINFNNLLNTVNFGNPVGSLSSSRFGQSTSTAFAFGGFGGGGFGGGSAANRKVELQMRFSW